LKWFTYVNQEKSHEHRHGRSRRIGYRSTSSPPGFLFGTDDGTPLTDEDLSSIAFDPQLTEMMDGGFYMLPQDDGTVIITDSHEYAELPDQASTDEPPVKLVSKGVLYNVNLHQRFNDCREVIKLSLGCAECPYRGVTCLKRSLPVTEDPVIDGPPAIDKEKAADKLRHGKTIVGGFTFASPMMTIPKDFNFTPKWRHPSEHDFSTINYWKEIRGAGAKTGAEYRRFKRDQCSACPLKNACSAHRTCSGKYPSEEQMLKETLELWLPRIEKAPFEPWQFWALARAAGRSGKLNKKQRETRHYRRHIMLSGLVWDNYNGFRAEVWYTRRPTGAAFTSTNYGQLTELFELPTSEKGSDYSYLGRTPERNYALMYWLLSLEIHRKHIRGGWGGRIVEVASRRLTDRTVDVEWMDHYGIRGNRYSHSVQVYSLNTLFIGVFNYGKLPFDQEVQPGRREGSHFYHSRSMG
jgi:hypothetical protein